MWKLTTYDGRTDEDGHQVMAKAQMAFGQVRSKGLDLVYKIQYPYLSSSV
jgi:hypothetical protein